MVGIGCNQLGRLEPDRVKAIVDACLDVGANFFDTADIYGSGASEENLGAAIGGRFDRVIIATKFAGRMGEGQLDRGGSRLYLMRAVEASLRRLGTDHIDLYQMHWPDPETPIEETLRALDDLVHQGKVRYIGCSNFKAWQVVEAQSTAEHAGLNRFISAQSEFSLLVRDVRAELLPACSAAGLGLLPYFPLASGFLTGKYRRGEKPPQEYRLSRSTMAGRLLTDANFSLLAQLEAFASARGHSLLELAIGWLLSHPEVPSVIAGVTGPEQVRANAAAATWQLGDQERAEVDAILAGA